QVVDDMYTQVAEKWLADQPTLTKLQKEFLEKAEALYQTFASEETADPQVQHGAMAALHRLGVIRGRLGRDAEAESALGQAGERARNLTLRYPDRPEFRLDLAKSRYEIALVYEAAGPSNPGVVAEAGHLREEEQELRGAIDEIAKLRAASPVVAEYRKTL